jgi:hypothetical protein
LKTKAQHKVDKEMLLRVQKDRDAAEFLVQDLDQKAPTELHRDLIELSQKLSEANLSRA